MDTCSETYGRGALACGVDTAMEYLLHILKELRLGSTRVSQQQHVNVAPDSVLSAYILGFASEERQCKSLLHILVPVDTGGNRVDDLLTNVGLFSKLDNRLLIIISNIQDILISISSDIVCFNNGLEHREAVFDVSEVVEPVDKYSSDFYFVTWSCRVNQVVENKDFFLAGNTSRRHSARSLLNGHSLVVSVHSLSLIKGVGSISLAQHTLPQDLLCFIP